MTHHVSTKQDDKIVVHVAAVLKDLIPRYLENRHNDIKSMLEALERGDYETIRLVGHGMKGSGGGYGFHTITDIGQCLEQAAQNGHSEEIRKWVNELSTYLARVEIVQPAHKDVSLDEAPSHPTTNAQRKKIPCTIQRSEVTPFYNFTQFKEFLFDQLNLPIETRSKLSKISPDKIYTISSSLGIEEREISQYIAQFLRLTYIPHIYPKDVRTEVLPKPFCKTNNIVAIKSVSSEMIFVLSNPFKLDLLDSLRRFSNVDGELIFAITEPKNIKLLLPKTTEAPIKNGSVDKAKKTTTRPLRDEVATLLEPDVKDTKIVRTSNIILDKAVSQRASDIHIEPKETRTVVRFRVDGDMRDMLTMEKSAGVRLISRFKVLGNLDIAEKRKPQDGAFETTIQSRAFKLRLATSSTPNGESLIMRLLESSAKPPRLYELGMTDDQVKTMLDLTNRSQGLILFVGPTGAGKTTTIYSLIANIDCKSCSLVSVEDPVEYRIPHANQQQVNDKAGLTFEALLKSVVRQDPDILYLGEVRDQFSAKISIDFASTGHLAITSLHSSNATTAIYRLERLGCSRSAIAEALLGVVAQKLLKKLCPLCKEIREISQEEIDMLAPFIHETPAQVAHPVGCPKCHNTGYFGREGVYEILQFDRDIASMTQSGMSIAEIRDFAWDRGDYLTGHHAAKKVKELLISPRDAYTHVLADDAKLIQKTPTVLQKETLIRQKNVDGITSKKTTSENTTSNSFSILIVEDDKDIQNLIKIFLEDEGYETITASDGVDALQYLGKKDFNLIISDINMPNLNGFELLDFNNKKDITTPVMFLTARTSEHDEREGLELGAIDYIKKPIKKEILLLRVKRALKSV